jgi:phosphatidylinositol alpha-1,6-mannosyltransferase
VARHLLVTNDFPPKVGGIQSYLWELWRRLPPDEVVVHTTPHRDAERFDAAQEFPIIRAPEPALLPQPLLVRRVNQLVREHHANLVVIDPAVPAGLIGPHLDVPYAVVLHGAEVTIPGRLPGTRQLLARVLNGAIGVIAAGGYPAEEAERTVGHPLPTTVVPPGVDTKRIEPLGNTSRREARHRLGLAVDAPLVVCVSRLVPRKGMDTLIRAAALLKPARREMVVAIAGKGRDRRRLERLVAELDAPVRFLGRIPDADLPGLYGCADVFAMMCRTRWGGLEQEGFGIVFLEAAAAGVPQVAGRSGGAHEAVVHGETGLIVDDPESVTDTAAAIEKLIGDDRLRRRMGLSARRRAETEFSYDVLAARLHAAVAAMTP